MGAGAISAAGLAAAMFLFHRGRDRPAAPGRQTLPGGVEYRPPDDLRPAQLRSLLTERVDKVSLSATLVDLAVRGYVRIEEVEDSKRRRKPDWLIRRQPDRSSKGLLKFEKEVLKGLFKGGRSQVRVSELGRGAFYQHYQAVHNLLYTDLVRRRFYARSPRTVRRVATMVALLVLSASFAGMVLVFAADLNLGLLVAPLPIIGLLLLIGARHAPRRTPTGTAMYRRAAGFREFIRTAEADRMAFAEREQIFADYLPYAMAFDCVERWVEVFARLGVSPQTAAGDWYEGRTMFDAGGFSSAMSSLGSQVGGSMRQNVASSGSSGFSSGSSGGGLAEVAVAAGNSTASLASSLTPVSARPRRDRARLGEPRQAKTRASYWPRPTVRSSTRRISPASSCEPCTNIGRPARPKPMSPGPVHPPRCPAARAKSGWGANPSPTA